MAYQPKIITGKVKDTGWPIDGRVLYFSLWDYDKHGCYHLHCWEDADDEAVMLTMFQSEVDAGLCDDDLEAFTEAWNAGEWEPDGVFCLDLDQVEVLEVVHEEEKNDTSEDTYTGGSLMENQTEKKHSAVVGCFVLVTLGLWALLIVLKGIGVVDMHWALVLSGILWISWLLCALVALVALVAFIVYLFVERKRRYRRRAEDKRIIQQAKAAGVWDNPQALGGRALELKALNDYMLLRMPGETDANLRGRCIVEMTRGKENPQQERGGGHGA